MSTGSDRFFAYARERHQTMLRRRDGHHPITEDEILQQYRFTCVFREEDATTIWFRDHVRERMRSAPEVLLATVLFRWFNRISTGEAIFQQPLLSGSTPWEDLIAIHPPAIALERMQGAIRSYCGTGPYVTGAYIIKTPDGMDKLSGVLWCVEQLMTSMRDTEHFLHCDWREVAATLLDEPGVWPQEWVWEWLTRHAYMGDFMAYEVVTDLRHTDLLSRAPDIMTWANLGPGARRGLNRVHDRPIGARSTVAESLGEMQELLRESTRRRSWPSEWPRWEMREVEHTLCEFDKYERVRLGQGKPRQRFRAG